MALDNLDNYWKLAWQKEQFTSNPQPGANSVMKSLANPPASGLSAENNVNSIEERDEQHTAYLAGHPQFDGMFTAD